MFRMIAARYTTLGLSSVPDMKHACRFLTLGSTGSACLHTPVLVVTVHTCYDQHVNIADLEKGTDLGVVLSQVVV
jgi:hypothetical protein